MTKEKLCVCGDEESQHVDNQEQCVIPECGCKGFEEKEEENKQDLNCEPPPIHQLCVKLYGENYKPEQLNHTISALEYLSDSESRMERSDEVSRENAEAIN